MKEAYVHGVKLEGGSEIPPYVKLLTDSGIPMMSHIGLTPLSEHQLSGYKIQGRSDKALQTLLKDAVFRKNLPTRFVQEFILQRSTLISLLLSDHSDYAL